MRMRVRMMMSMTMIMGLSAGLGVGVIRGRRIICKKCILGWCVGTVGMIAMGGF
jgi:hypothetical protein